MSSSSVECRLCCVWNLKRLLKWFGQQIPSTTPESHVAQQSKPRNATLPGLPSIRRSDTKIVRVRLVVLVASGASRDSDVSHAFCFQPLPSQARRSSTLKATSSFHERKLKLDPQIKSFEGLLCLRRALTSPLACWLDVNKLEQSDAAADSFPGRVRFHEPFVNPDCATDIAVISSPDCCSLLITSREVNKPLPSN